jgi:hypothetical protein
LPVDAAARVNSRVKWTSRCRVVASRRERHRHEELRQVVSSRIDCSRAAHRSRSFWSRCRSMACFSRSCASKTLGKGAHEPAASVFLDHTRTRSDRAVVVGPVASLFPRHACATACCVRRFC